MSPDKMYNLACREKLAVSFSGTSTVIKKELPLLESLPDEEILCISVLVQQYIQEGMSVPEIAKVFSEDLGETLTDDEADLVRISILSHFEVQSEKPMDVNGAQSFFGKARNAFRPFFFSSK